MHESTNIYIHSYLSSNCITPLKKITHHWGKSLSVDTLKGRTIIVLLQLQQKHTWLFQLTVL